MRAAGPERAVAIHRLFDSAEFDKIVRQPGMSRAVVRKLKRQRCAILLKHLKHLRRDAVAASRVSVVHARADSQGSPAALAGRWQVEFAVLRIGLNLLLHQAGWATIKVETVRLTVQLAKLQLDALRLAY